MRRVVFIILAAMLILGAAGGYRWYWQHKELFDPLGQKSETISKDLEKYDFDNLRKRGGKPGAWEIIGEPKEVNVRRKIAGEKKIAWTSRVFRFQSNGKWISGVVNYWPDGKQHSTVIMVRGYADKPGYYPGFGSWKMADALAKKGMNTVSLDFLGYGLSDRESLDGMEARFEKVPAVLDLLETVKKLPYVNPEKIGLWAHSNGGQIVISVLEVTQGNYPTVLWAPMTNPFPQSVLDTASSNDDGGVAVTQMIAAFQKQYDARRYAFENYYGWIKSKVKIFQGTKDEWCKVEWQQKVVEAIKAQGYQAELTVVEGDDHNFSKNWDQVAAASSDYFGQNLML